MYLAVKIKCFEAVVASAAKNLDQALLLKHGINLTRVEVLSVAEELNDLKMMNRISFELKQLKERTLHEVTD